MKSIKTLCNILKSHITYFLSISIFSLVNQKLFIQGLCFLGRPNYYVWKIPGMCWWDDVNEYRST